MVLGQIAKEAHVTLSGTKPHQQRDSTSPDAAGGYGPDYDDDRRTDEVCSVFYRKDQQGVPDSLIQRATDQVGKRVKASMV